MQRSASNGRWMILALLMGYAGLCHFNRIAISVAGTEHLMPDYGISETRMGIVYSSYLFVYMLCMIPGGWLIDRFGPKRAFLFMGLASSLLVPATALSKFATPLAIVPLLCVIRGMLGIASAPMHPGAARAVSLWFPRPDRGLANGLVTGAAVTGIALTYYVFGSLMDTAGWPLAFVISGFVTLALTIMWASLATDRPADGAEASADALARAPVPPPVVEGVIPAGRVRSLVYLTLSYAALSYLQYLFFYWMQHYFDVVLELGKEQGRLYATIPTVAMAVGMMCGGWIADRAQRLLGGLSGQSLPPFAWMFSSAAFFLLGIMGSDPKFVVACFALAMGALGASEPSFWVTGVELGGARGGLWASILNAGGNAGGILAPVVTPAIAERFGWTASMAIAGGICAAGAGLWWLIEPLSPAASDQDWSAAMVHSDAL